MEAYLSEIRAQARRAKGKGGGRGKAPHGKGGRGAVIPEKVEQEGWFSRQLYDEYGNEYESDFFSGYFPPELDLEEEEYGYGGMGSLAARNGGFKGQSMKGGKGRKGGVGTRSGGNKGGGGWGPETERGFYDEGGKGGPYEMEPYGEERGQQRRGRGF